MDLNIGEPLKPGYGKEEANNTVKRRDDRILKIIIISQGMSLAVHPLLNSRHKIVGIINSEPQRKPGKLLRLAQSIYGVMNRKPSTLKKLASLHGLPYYAMSNTSDDRLADWVRTLAPDVIAIHTMSHLLKENIFSIPKLGTINLHASYLPEYRGPNPSFWQYHDMQMNPGVTVHYVDKGEDTGDIIFQARTYVPLGTKAPDRLAKMIGDTGAPLLLKALDALAASAAPRIPQPHASPTCRARNIRYEEHKTIIDWNHWEIERIWHLLRGTENWLDAIDLPSGLYSGQRWSIGEYVKCDTSMQRYCPSKIYRDKDHYFLACKDGKIFLSKTFTIKRLLYKLLH